MGRKIKIRKVSSWSIGITIFVAGLFLTIAVMSSRKFSILHDTTEQYIECERAAKQLQDAMDGSRHLMETEYYSMKLIAVANHLDMADFPEEI